MKSRRRSTSYGKRSPGGECIRSKSVEVSGGGIDSIREEVGEVSDRGAGCGGASNLVDDVFEESKPYLEQDVSVGASEVQGVEVPDMSGNDKNVVDDDGGAVGGIGEKEKNRDDTIEEVRADGQLENPVADSGSGVGGVSDSRGAEGGHSNESVIEPVHHIPRWKLREILAHAEGKCILSVILLCAYRKGEVQRMLGVMLPSC